MRNSPPGIGDLRLTSRLDLVAKLVPVKKKASPKERLAAIERIQKLATGLSLGGLKIKDLIREGRR